MLSSIFSIFIIIFAGYILRQFSVLKKSWLKVMNSFVYYIALPALVVNSIATYNWQSDQLLDLLLGNAIFLVLSAVITIGVMLLLPISRKNKSVVALIAITGNTVYLGIPLVNELIGGSFSSSLNGPITAISVIQLVGSLIVIVNLLELFLVSKNDKRSYISHLVKNPLLLSAFVGSLLAFLGVFNGTFEDLFGGPIQMVAATASPLALLALGGFLHGIKWRKIDVSIILSSLLLKMAVLPIIAYFVFSNFDTESNIFNSSVLMAGMPVAITAFVLSDEYKLNKENVSIAILVSTVLAPFTVLLLTSLIGL